ncbi:MAG: hypothetical protein WA862_09275 [Solirubrobacterales bacterium]
MATITEHEAKQIEAANAGGKTPVAFIHGLWLLPSSWSNRAGVFEEAGYAAVTPVWPDVKIPNRGHSLTIDSGWREVCDTALAFVKRFT